VRAVAMEHGLDGDAVLSHVKSQGGKKTR
jgi:hypothetical protein